MSRNRVLQRDKTREYIMNIQAILTIFLMALTGPHIAAMQQPNLRQQLINAAKEGNNELVEQLVSIGAPVAPRALYYPTTRGNYDIVKTIFECGVDPESPADPNRRLGTSTLFMHLAFDQKLQPQVKEKLIKLYVKHGADIELRNDSGSSMLINDVHNLDFNTLKLFLELGADASAQNNTGFTALMILALAPIHVSSKKIKSEKMRELELKKMAELLIEHGADVNQKDNVGQTSLMKAISIGNRTFVELLIKNGADVKLKNHRGKSALDYAKNHPETLKLLKGTQKTN